MSEKSQSRRQVFLHKPRGVLRVDDLRVLPRAIPSIGSSTRSSRVGVSPAARTSRPITSPSSNWWLSESGYALMSRRSGPTPPANEPDGQISKNLSSPPLQKYSDFPKTQITFITLAVLSHRGATRDRHGRGAGCGGRGCGLDERR
jgi:hypothetical protein